MAGIQRSTFRALGLGPAVAAVVAFQALCMQLAAAGSSTDVTVTMNPEASTMAQEEPEDGLALPKGAIIGISIGGGVLLLLLIISCCTIGRRLFRNKGMCMDLEQLKFGDCLNPKELVASPNFVTQLEPADELEMQKMHGQPGGGGISNVVAAGTVQATGNNKMASIMRWLSEADTPVPTGVAEHVKAVYSDKELLLSRDLKRSDQKGIVYNKLPASVSASPAPSTIDGSARMRIPLLQDFGSQDSAAILHMMSMEERGGAAGYMGQAAPYRVGSLGRNSSRGRPGDNGFSRNSLGLAFAPVSLSRRSSMREDSFTSASIAAIAAAAAAAAPHSSQGPPALARNSRSSRLSYPNGTTDGAPSPTPHPSGIPLPQSTSRASSLRTDLPGWTTFKESHGSTGPTALDFALPPPSTTAATAPAMDSLDMKIPSQVLFGSSDNSLQTSVTGYHPPALNLDSSSTAGPAASPLTVSPKGVALPPVAEEVDMPDNGTGGGKGQRGIMTATPPGSSAPAVRPLGAGIATFVMPSLSLSASAGASAAEMAGSSSGRPAPLNTPALQSITSPTQAPYSNPVLALGTTADIPGSTMYITTVSEHHQPSGQQKQQKQRRGRLGTAPLPTSPQPQEVGTDTLLPVSVPSSEGATAICHAPVTVGSAE